MKEEIQKDENKKDLDISPKTADSYNIGICILLAVIGGITAMAVYIRRKRY